MGAAFDAIVRLHLRWLPQETRDGLREAEEWRRDRVRLHYRILADKLGAFVHKDGKRREDGRRGEGGRRDAGVGTMRTRISKLWRRMFPRLRCPQCNNWVSRRNRALYRSTHISWNVSAGTWIP
jgi:hypothetical protein